MSSPASTSTVPKDPSPSDEPEDAGAAGAAVVAAGAAVVAVAAEELLEELLSSPSDPQAPAINPSAKTADNIRQLRRLISVSIKKAPSFIKQIQWSNGLTVCLSHSTINICVAQIQRNIVIKNI